MRRADREIQALDEIVAVLDRCETIRLGINGGDYPYVVPLSFGYALEDGRLAVYFHGAGEGLKHTLLAADSRVCIEADMCHRFVEHGGDFTCEYESVIGFGRAQQVSGSEAERGLDLLMAHCGFAGRKYDRRVLSITTVYKITVEQITGKRRRI